MPATVKQFSLLSAAVCAQSPGCTEKSLFIAQHIFGTASSHSCDKQLQAEHRERRWSEPEHTPTVCSHFQQGGLLQAYSQASSNPWFWWCRKRLKCPSPSQACAQPNTSIIIWEKMIPWNAVQQSISAVLGFPFHPTWPKGEGQEGSIPVTVKLLGFLRCPHIYSHAQHGQF